MKPDSGEMPVVDETSATDWGDVEPGGLDAEKSEVPQELSPTAKVHITAQPNTRPPRDQHLGAIISAATALLLTKR